MDAVTRPALLPVRAFGAHEFHTLRLAGRTFRGLVTREGPRLECGERFVPLRSAAVNWFGVDAVTARGAVLEEGWHVALDGTHPRISLVGLDDFEFGRLLQTFGLPVAPFTSRREVFHGSPAFEHLVEWVERHPIHVARLIDDAGAVPEWLQGVERWSDAGRKLAAHPGC